MKNIIVKNNVWTDPNCVIYSELIINFCLYMLVMRIFEDFNESFHSSWTRSLNNVCYWNSGYRGVSVNAYFNEIWVFRTYCWQFGKLWRIYLNKNTQTVFLLLRSDFLFRTENESRATLPKTLFGTNFIFQVQNQHEFRYCFP